MAESPRSGPAGTVEFGVRSGIDLVVQARSERGEAKPMSLDIPALHALERREVLVEMDVDDDIHFQGLVLAAETRAPIAGASVFLELDDESEFDFTLSRSSDSLRTPAVVSDAGGRFELKSASWRHPRVRVEADGYAPAFLAPHPGHEKETATILLGRGAGLDVLVVDARGAPLPDITVVLSADGMRLLGSGGTFELASMQSEVTWSATTDADGRCQLRRIVASVPLFVVLMMGKKVVHTDLPPITLNGGEERSVIWKVGGGCELAGIVFDDTDARLAHRELWLQRAYLPRPGYFTRDGDTSRAKATTNEKGEFSFHGIEPGQWWIGIAPTSSDAYERDGRDLVPLAQVCEVPDGAQRIDINVMVRHGGFIRGQVTDSSNQPAKEATVWLRANETRDEARIVTFVNADYRGKFAFGPLPPGQFQLTAKARDGAVPSKPVTVRDGTDGVVLELRAGCRLEGRVIDAATREGRRAEIVVSSRDPTIANKIEHTQDDGSFSLRGIESGTYDLIARIDEGRVAVLRAVNLGSGEHLENVVLALESGARVAVRYDGHAAECFFRIFSGDAIVGANELSKGETGVRVVPAGKLRIEFSFGADAKQFSRDVDVIPGEAKEVVFTDDG
jgi:hypothetical protein